MNEFSVGLFIIVIFVLVLLSACMRRSVLQLSFITAAVSLIIILFMNSNAPSKQQPAVVHLKSFRPKEIFELPHRGEGDTFDVDYKIHSGQSIKRIFKDMGGAGDNRMARRSMIQSGRFKRSQDIRSNYTRATMDSFDSSELDMQEKRVWWEDMSPTQELL